MKHSIFVACATAGLLLSGCSGGSSAPASVPTSSPPDIEGTYELTKRVMADGTEIRPPAIMAIYGMDHGRGNLNLFMRNKDDTIASESTISKYTLTATEYCEWILYTTRNNLDGPGATNLIPGVRNPCSKLTTDNGRIVVVPPGEGGIETSYDKDGLVAKIPGQFVDYWQKIR